MRIAVVGAGISGLTAAHVLGREHHVTLFDAAPRLGGHTHTVDVEVDGVGLAVDTGFIVFNERNYPCFTRLLEELGVASRPTRMSFSVRRDSIGLEYCGSSLNGLFAQRLNLFQPRFLAMLRDIARFNRLGDRLDEVDERQTVAELLSRHRLGRGFAEDYLLPMGAAIWSCPTGAFERFPARFLLEFFRNHGLLSLRDRPQWRVIDGGSRTYVERMRERFQGTIRLGTPIVRVRREVDAVELTPRGAAPEPFDHVVFACHADQALRILGDAAAPVERELLSAFPYQRNSAVLHTDASVLPRRRRAWASWNYLVLDDQERPATVTYWMNLLQHLPVARPVCVTLNADERIEPSRVLGRYLYDHPVFDTRRAECQRRHVELLGPRRTSYCGAYWGNGFHEDGVRSALAVCEALRGRVPGPSTDDARAGVHEPILPAFDGRPPQPLAM